MTSPPTAPRSGDSLRIAREVVVEVGKNVAMGVPAVRDRRLKQPRTSDARSNEAWLERYAFQALRAVLPVTGTLAGRRVVEFGPGDYLTSGLALLAAGAESYTAMDRFPADYSSAAAKARYRSVQESWGTTFPDLPWPPWLDWRRFPDAYGDRVVVEAASIEDTAVTGSFDVVCSFQVGEHVSDISAFAQQTRRLLAPDGVAVHRVDFGPHGRWRSLSDPYAFLRPSEPLWSAMGSKRGTPNRRRAHELRAAFAAAGLDVDEVVRELFDGPPDDATRRRFARRFRTMPTESLEVRAVTYACRLVG